MVDIIIAAMADKARDQPITLARDQALRQINKFRTINLTNAQADLFKVTLHASQALIEGRRLCDTSPRQGCCSAPAQQKRSASLTLGSRRRLLPARAAETLR